jgi:hypothetical protein
MQVVFLGAQLPLTKTFAARGGVISSAPYPHVTRVTSYHTEASGLVDFAKLLQQHAAEGHCLFNGKLEHPLHHESRAGKTRKDPHDFVVFDFDKVEGTSAADVISRYLPPSCQNVSYVSQLSASMFRPDTSLWSGHIFMLLKTPATDEQLRSWFEYMNFSQPKLTASIRLSDSMQALHWPLDRTVAYSSKLIYIAPPKCHGFEPAIKEHIEYVKRKQSHVVIPSFVPIDTSTVRQKINELRRAVGEDEIDYEVTVFEGQDILKKTGLCDVHGLKTSGGHYIRFNLNGGDSYAYFIDLRNPGLIKNFKGEPFLRTQDAAPDLYKALTKSKARILSKPPLDDDAEVLAFYATNRESQVKLGVFLPTKRSLRIENSSPVAAHAWLAEYGLVQKGPFPHIDLVFDPKSDIQYTPGSTQINTFKASDYMARKPSTTQPSSMQDFEGSKTLMRTIRHMLGAPDETVVRHFINWLAFIFQRREKSQHAWVLHGRTGTGKSSFVKYLLMPLFGPENVRVVQFGLVMGQFNGYLEQALFCIYEEADSTSVGNNAELMTKLRHYITETTLEMNEKNVKTVQRPNYTNFIFNSNANAPVQVPADDRRFTIAERQTEQIFYTPNELNALLTGTELDGFADALSRWPVDPIAAMKPIETQAKRVVHEASTSINQLIAEAVRAGDLQFFIDRTPTEAEALGDFNNRYNPSGLFRALIDRYIDHAKHNKPSVISDEDMFVLFRTLIPDAKYFQDSKTWRRRHYTALGLDMGKQHRNPANYKELIRGMKVQWTVPSELPKPKQTHDGNVVTLKKVR